jgi:hypothetical protein
LRSILAPAAGTCRGRMTEYVELHARSAYSFLDVERRRHRCDPAALSSAPMCTRIPRFCASM